MLKKAFSNLVDLIYPRVCLACAKKLPASAKEETYLCGPCTNKIKRNRPPFCHCCGKHLNEKSLHKNLCVTCLKMPLYFDRAFSPYIYEDILKTLIHKFKYQRKDYLGGFLSSMLLDFIQDYDLPIAYLDLIIPIPLHKAKLREREFNQAEVLAKGISHRFNKPMDTFILTRRTNTKSQTALDHEKRFQNIRGNFALESHSSVEGKNILLVDDVLTTGATCSEAARILKEKGAGVVFVLTLAS
ncbi:MAG: ComF family protein [Candidatus Omnitrophica bacterium]|jgi:ComF family protein|nr:ComF family protein [Candidatus Omnitrophota bacterium]